VMAGVPIGEATALGALAGSAVEEVIGQLYQDRAERVARFAQTAAGEAGCTLDELLAEAAEHQVKLELLAQAVEGASRALADEKVDLLARMVVQGIRDDAKVDKTLVMFDAVRVLELPHLRLLALLARPSHLEVDCFRLPDQLWHESQISAAEPEIGKVFSGVMAKLQSLSWSRSWLSL
jgi:hypothetical protein